LLTEIESRRRPALPIPSAASGFADRTAAGSGRRHPAGTNGQ
jgi:hypothetical protein